MSLLSINLRLLMLSIMIALLMSGCQTLAPQQLQTLTFAPEDLEMSNPGWRRCYFKIDWPKDSEARFEIDLLLAHQVFAPVLNQYGDSLYRWRFHRRAARDPGGHQFSLLFYSGSDIAEKVIIQVAHSEITRHLIDEGVIEASYCSSSEDETQTLISDTSDPAWPDAIQRQWPAFIMGVSMTWLGLIDEVASPLVKQDMNVKQLIEIYSDAEQQLISMWTINGQHVFLHHLSALFGYEALLIRY